MLAELMGRSSLGLHALLQSPSMDVFFTYFFFAAKLEAPSLVLREGKENRSAEHFTFEYWNLFWWINIGGDGIVILRLKFDILLERFF